MSDASTPRVRMYTTPWCPYCVGARRFFAARGIAVDDIDVSRDRATRDQITAETGWRTVPMIFVDDVFVGGYDDLMRKVKRGEIAGVS